MERALRDKEKAVEEAKRRLAAHKAAQRRVEMEKAADDLKAADARIEAARKRRQDLVRWWLLVVMVCCGGGYLWWLLPHTHSQHSTRNIPTWARARCLRAPCWSLLGVVGRFACCGALLSHTDV